MSLQKKNVIQEFIKEEYVPTSEQFIVKYCSGKGNNLHEVECFEGNTLLVSMPKKFRHTVWLKKDDCLVIDPIDEGKKVKGEIVCRLPNDSVCDLIKNSEWPLSSTSEPGISTEEKEALLRFFNRGAAPKPTRDELDVFPPSDSSELGSEDDGEEEEDTDEEAAENEGDAEDEEEEGSAGSWNSK